MQAREPPPRVAEPARSRVPLGPPPRFKPEPRLTAAIETETGIGTEIVSGTEGDATEEIFDETRVITVSLEIFATTEKKIAALISDT